MPRRYACEPYTIRRKLSVSGVAIHQRPPSVTPGPQRLIGRAVIVGWFALRKLRPTTFLNEATPDNVSYKCWFLAKVAFINGDNVACKRELNHASGDPANKVDVAALRGDLTKKEGAQRKGASR